MLHRVSTPAVICLTCLFAVPALGWEANWYAYHRESGDGTYSRGEHLGFDLTTRVCSQYRVEMKDSVRMEETLPRPKSDCAAFELAARLSRENNGCENEESDLEGTAPHLGYSKRRVLNEGCLCSVEVRQWTLSDNRRYEERKRFCSPEEWEDALGLPLD